MVKQARGLRYAVRFRVICKYFGQLCLVLAALTLVPGLMSVIFGDTTISLRYGTVICGLIALGSGLVRLRAPSQVQANEGIITHFRLEEMSETKMEETRMKKLLITAGTLMMMSSMLLPAFAQQYQGYGMGPGMMGYNPYQRQTVDENTQKAYDEEMAKHYKDNAEQRQEIVVKQHEIATLLVNPKTNKDALIEKQKEVQELMNTLQRDELSFRWDLRQKYPEIVSDVYGGCLAPAAGYGGAGMMGYGPYGPDMMDSDEYNDRGYDGMMGNGRWNWQKQEPLRDNRK